MRPNSCEGLLQNSGSVPSSTTPARNPGTSRGGRAVLSTGTGTATSPGQPWQQTRGFACGDSLLSDKGWASHCCFPPIGAVEGSPQRRALLGTSEHTAAALPGCWGQGRCYDSQLQRRSCRCSPRPATSCQGTAEHGCWHTWSMQLPAAHPLPNMQRNQHASSHSFLPGSAAPAAGKPFSKGMELGWESHTGHQL